MERLQQAKRILMVAVMIVGARTARADDKNDYLLYQLGQQASVWWRDAGGMWGVRGSSKGCMAVFDKIAAAHVPETATFTLTTPAPGLDAGEHPWPEAKRLCERMVPAEAMVAAKQWLGLARHDAESPHGPPDAAIYGACINAYNLAKAAGVADTDPVDVGDAQTTLGAAMAKWCAAGKKKFDEVAEKRAAPYKKVLKADKLAMALVDPAFFLPGGSATTDARKLAAASVWFRDTESDSPCPNGRPAHVVHRYQFNAAHKLVRTTDKDYCGAPPASAYR